MIYPIAGLFLGAAFGAWRARSKGGKLFDLLQWGAAYGIMFGILGLFVLIIIERSFL